MTDTRDVVILEAARTPIGRGHREKGYYRDVHPADLLGHSYCAVLERADVPPESVELAIAGCVQQFGEQSMNIARTAWLQECLPVETSALTLDMRWPAEIAVHAPFGLRMTKQILHSNIDAPSLEAALELEDRGQALAVRDPAMREALSIFRRSRVKADAWAIPSQVNNDERSG